MNTNANTNSRSFTRREWLMALAILLMLEAWILNIGYHFDTDTDVINYVSFAATIASLLLALLAIIYGFYQSDGQQKSAVAIALELESMREVQRVLGETASGMADHMQQITSTTAVLKSISESVDSAHAKIGSIEGGISTIEQKQDMLQAALVHQPNQASTTTPSFDAIKIAAENVLRRTSFQADLIGYALCRAFTVAGKNQIPFWAFLDRFVAMPLDGKKSMQAAEWKSLATNLLMVLNAFKVITVKFDQDASKSKIDVTPAVLDILKEQSLETKDNAHTKDESNLLDAIGW